MALINVVSKIVEIIMDCNLLFSTYVSVRRLLLPSTVDDGVNVAPLTPRPFTPYAFINYNNIMMK